MVAENISQYGPLAGAYAAGAGSAWGFVMRVLLPKEMKVMMVRQENLERRIAEMTPEIEEYRQLKKSALERELREKKQNNEGN